MQGDYKAFVPFLITVTKYLTNVAYGFRSVLKVHPILSSKAQQQQCEAAGGMAPTDRKQSRGVLLFILLSLFYSVRDLALRSDYPCLGFILPLQVNLMEPSSQTHPEACVHRVSQSNQVDDDGQPSHRVSDSLTEF